LEKELNPKRVTMERMNQVEGRYRVILIGIENHTEERKEYFLNSFSKHYGLSSSQLRKIVDHCPIVLKENLTLKKAKTLAKTLQHYGATVSIEERRDLSPIFLEFQKIAPYQVALESAYLRRTPSEGWNLIGRVKNISEESLNDTWVLIQLFDALEEFLTFEEVPIPINPLPAGESSPFKVVLEGDIPIQKVSISFKNSSGNILPASDRRKRKWVEGDIPEYDGKTPSVQIRETSEEISRPHEIEVSPASEEINQEKGEVREGTLGEPIFSEIGERPLEAVPEIPEKNKDIMLRMVEESRPLGEEGLEIALEHETSQASTISGLEEGVEEGGKALLEWAPPIEDGREKFQESPLDTCSHEEGLQRIEDISAVTEKGEEELPPFLWIEDFRQSIEIYYQNPRDQFINWFKTQQKYGGFVDSAHSLLTILVYARFNQMNQLEKALKNTEREFRLILQPELRLEEISPLEGTPFFSGEIWRDLFFRAIPKLKQVANNIIEKKKWNALDLERLIQVIPHISIQNSRMSVRLIHELISGVVKIDFSDTPIYIRESLYRVASRLGVVNPYFDYYQGRNSMGDLKIQSFAKDAFPQYPIKIEEPMTWMGVKEEGGHCFPFQPQCEGCLFETFCPRLYFNLNPSEKGMRDR
jgi:hypothetical protein